MPDNRYYIFKDAKGGKHTVDKAAYDSDPEGFAKAFPGARMEVIDRKTCLLYTSDAASAATKDCIGKSPAERGAREVGR